MTTAPHRRLLDAAAIVASILLTSAIIGGTGDTGALLASAVLTTAFLLISAGARPAVILAVLPQARLAGTLRRKAWRAAYLRVTDPDARGRSRPRAPAAA